MARLAQKPIQRSPAKPVEAKVARRPLAGARRPAYLQAKLAVSQPQDAEERQADQVAAEVSRAPRAGLQRASLEPAITPVKKDESLAPKLAGQGSRQDMGGQSLDTDTATRIESLKGQGDPLQESLRRDMETQFGRDLSATRFHVDAQAEELCAQVQARAFTVGNDIFFAPGEFAPETEAGRELLAHELTHVVQQTGAASPSRLFRQPTGERKQETAVKTPLELAENVWTSLLAFSARATPELARVGANIKGYLDRYDTAYATFAKVLGEAKAEAAAREKWVDVVKGIVIGTGVGLAAGALYTASAIVLKIAYEAAGEGAEAVVGGALGGATTADFTPPPELHNDKVARGYLEKLLVAWQALALMQSATLAFSPRRDALRGAATGTGSKGGTPAAPKLADELARLRAALDAADKALTLFLTTADTPLLRRDPLTIEQDIWIAWMARGAANAREGAQPADESPISRRLDEIKIHGRLLREGDGFIYRSGEQLTVYARDEISRVARIGQVGVVIVPPRPLSGQRQVRLGVVRLRHDANSAVGRADPNPTGTADYVRIVWQPQTYLRPGEVVMVNSTTAYGLTVSRLGPELAVARDERAAALRLLGITEPEYDPEAAALLWSYVWSAVNWELKNEPPPLQLSSSENGVLVSQADGKKIVLFTPLTSIADAKASRDRLGAPRVVAIEIDSQAVGVWGEVAPGVVLTNRSDVVSIANEIRAARRVVGQASQAAKP